MKVVFDSLCGHHNVCACMIIACILHVVVICRLVIQNNSLPDVWFKDEGGRDKCIELNICLKDHNDDTIVERKVPLKVFLLYADGNRVLKQEILKISPDSKLHLGKYLYLGLVFCVDLHVTLSFFVSWFRFADDRGQASLRLRIDDVSKNHQKQSFLIQIAPDTNSHPLNNDISPDECTPLEVRSKRNKGKRPRDDDPPVQSVSSNASGNKAAQKIAIVSNRGSAAIASSDIKITKDTSTIAATASSASVASSSELQTVSRSSLEKLAVENKRLNDLMSNFKTDEKPNASAPSAEQVGKTIEGLVEWSQSMMDALASMQWQLIGNEKLANGAVRPLYEMQNPNNTITELFGRYHDFAVPSLTLLYQNHFSQSGGGSVDEPNPVRVKRESANKDVGEWMFYFSSRILHVTHDK